MEKTVIATFYRLICTDTKPQHHFCPQGEDNWYKCRVLEVADTVQNFKYPPCTTSTRAKILTAVIQRSFPGKIFSKDV